MNPFSFKYLGLLVPKQTPLFRVVTCGTSVSCGRRGSSQDLPVFFPVFLEGRRSKCSDIDKQISFLLRPDADLRSAPRK